jgi:NAD(P)-dependent dehydrogenase (short-subunit alcohol dehydrogenase family)
MSALPDHYRVLVAGVGGAIGAAFVERLRSDSRCGAVHLLGRHTDPPLDYGSEDSVAAAADALRALAPFHRVIVATGVLHTAVAQPEKRLADLRLSAMEEVFRLNTFGPALMLRYFAPLLDRQGSVMALLSARVGSIGDNRLGGWYSYRASKAALNMMVRTAAIEMRRTHPGAVIVALHPGTVKSALSRPFRGDEIGRDPAQAAADMLTVLEALGPDDSGSFIAYDGQRIPW